MSGWELGDPGRVVREAGEGARAPNHQMQEPGFSEAGYTGVRT